MSHRTGVRRQHSLCKQHCIYVIQGWRSRQHTFTFLRLHIVHPDLDLRCGCRFRTGFPLVSIVVSANCLPPSGRTKNEKLPRSIASNIVFRLWNAQKGHWLYNVSNVDGVKTTLMTRCCSRRLSLMLGAYSHS